MVFREWRFLHQPNPVADSMHSIDKVTRWGSLAETGDPSIETGITRIQHRLATKRLFPKIPGSPQTSRRHHDGAFTAPVTMQTSRHLGQPPLRQTICSQQGVWSGRSPRSDLIRLESAGPEMTSLRGSMMHPHIVMPPPPTANRYVQDRARYVRGADARCTTEQFVLREGVRERPLNRPQVACPPTFRQWGNIACNAH